MRIMSKFRFILLIVMTMVGLEVFGQSDPSMTFTPEGSLIFEASGGELDVTVTTVNVSDWTISSVSESWVEATRSGDQIHVTVKPNSTGASRRATISVSSDDLEEDKTITIIQRAPTLDIGSGNRTISATSTGNLTCDVYSNARWKVEVTSSGNWLELVSPADGMGNGDGQIVLKPTGENTSTTDRVATVIITNRDYEAQSKSYTVTQLGSDIILTLSTSSLLSSNTGGEQNFTITSNKDLALTATDDATGGAPTWFTLDNSTFTASGVAAIEKGFKVTFEKNKSLKSRSGKISIKREGTEVTVITVTQSGTTASVTTSTDALNFMFNAKSDGKTNILKVMSNVPVQIGTVDYSATAGQENWLKITPISATHDDATVVSEKAFTVSVLSDNSSDNERVAKFNVIWIDENDVRQTKLVQVFQGGIGHIDFVSTNQILSGNVGGEQNFTITSNRDLTLTATDDATGGAPSWFRLDNTSFEASGVAAIVKSFKVTIDKNKSLKSRSGKITIKKGSTEVTVITVTQSGTTASVSTSTDAVNFESNAKTTGKSVSLKVTSNVPVQIGAVDYSSTAGQENWLKITPASATHDDATAASEKPFTLSVLSDNPSDNERVAKFNVMWTDENDRQQTKQIQVVQMGGDFIFSVSTPAVQSSNTGGEQNFTVKSNKDLTLTATDDATGGAPSWFRLDKSSFTASGVAAIDKAFKVTIDKNKSLKSRSGKITIKKGSTEVTVITVTQSGTTASVSTSTDAVNFESNAKTTGKSVSLKVTSNVPVQIGAVDYSSTAGQENWLKITPASATHDDATAASEKPFTLSVLSDNPSDNERVAKFNVMWTDENDRQQTKQIQVVQMGGDFIFSVSTPAVQSSNTGGEQNFTVKSNKDLTLTATDDATGGVPGWFRLDATSFTASGVSATAKSFKVTIDKNKSLKSRSGKITISRGSTGVTVISVSQSGTTASVTTSPDAVSFEAKANTNGKTAELKVTSNVPVQIGAVDYSATAGQSDWLKITPESAAHDDATATSEKVFTLSVLSDNASDGDRVAKFNVQWTDENDRQQTKQIQVVQMSGDFVFSVSTPTVQSGNTGGEQNFTVTSNKDLTLTATDDATGGVPGWFRLDATSFTASGVSATAKSFKVTIDKNKSLKSRSGKITISRGSTGVTVISVSQSGTTASVTTSPDAVSFEAKANTNGKTAELKVTSNVPVQIGAVDYSATAGQSDWFKIAPHSDNVTPDDATIQTELKFDLSVLSDNTSDISREASFNVIWNDEKDVRQTKQIKVVQLGGDISLEVSPQTTVQAKNVGEVKDLTVKCNKDLTLVVTDDATGMSPEWFRLNENTFTASGVDPVVKTFKLTIDKNKGLKRRNGKISFNRDGMEVYSVTVLQDGSSAVVSPKPEVVNIAANAHTTGVISELKVESNVPVQIGEVDYSATAGQSGWLEITPGNAPHEDATMQTEKLFHLSVLSDNTSDKERQATFNVIWTDENDRQQTKEIKVVHSAFTYTLSTRTLQSNNLGEKSETFTLSSNKDLTLKATDDATGKEPEWFRLDADKYEVKDKTKTFTVTFDKNKSLKARSGRISVMMDTTEVDVIKVEQSGASAKVTLPPNNAVTFAANAHTEGVISELKLESNVPVQIGEVDYLAPDGQSAWLKITPHSDNVTPDDATKQTELKFDLSVLSDNTSYKERQAKFNVIWSDENDQQQTMEIKVVHSAFTYTLSTQTLQSNNLGEKPETFTLSSNKDLTLKATDDATGKEPEWFRLDADKYEVKDKTKTFTVTFDKNKSLKARSGRISVMMDTTEVTFVKVEQSGTTARVYASEVSPLDGAKGSKQELTVKSNVPVQIGEVDYSATPGQEDWLEIAPHLDNMMPDDATVSVEMKYTLSVLSDNMTTSERRATFDLIYYDENDVQQRKPIQITQMYINASLSVTTISVFNASGSGDRLLKINSNVPWELSCDSTWVHTKHVKSNEPVYSGNGNDSLYVYVDDNTDLRQRSAKLIVNAGNESQEVSIIQYGTAYVAVDTLISFKVRESTDTLSVESNSPWEISIDESSIDESGKKWLTIESEYTKGKGSKDIPVQASFNSDTVKSRETYIYIQYMGPDDEIKTKSVRVIQERCPIVHEMKLDAANILVEDTTCVAIHPSDKAIHFTLGDENAKLEVNTAKFDIPKKWKFNWTVDNEPKSNTNELDLGSLFTEKRAYSVKVEAEYEDAPDSLKSTLEFYLYPCPKCPDELVMKGNGSSGIMIADFNGPVAFENDYEYIFGYDDTEDGTTRKLYYQYKEKDIVKDPETKKWVYAQWNIDATPITSINRRYVYKEGEKGSLEHMSRSHSSDPTAVTTIEGEVMLIRGGMLIANVATPRPAVIDIISVSGNTVRRMQLPSSKTFNEKIDFKGLSAGVYIVKCTIGHKHVEQKMVIK